MIIEVKVPAMTVVEIAMLNEHLNKIVYKHTGVLGESKISTLQAELEKAKELLREFERGKNGKLNFQEINDFQDRVTQFLEAK